jgi:hypothetical protein
MQRYAGTKRCSEMDAAAGERMQGLGAGKSLHPWMRFPVEFLIHQFLSTWGLFIAVPMVLVFFIELGLHFGLKVYMTQIDWLLYGTPVFPLHLATALIVGWVLAGTLRERAMLWVWVLPFVSCCTSQIGYPLLARGFSADYRFLAYSGFFEYSWGRLGTHSLQQVVGIALLYTAIAYSVGGLLAFRVVRAPAFFESMRSLRKTRLVLVVGLPWFCFKLLLSWQSVSAQTIAAGWSAGLLYYLRGLFTMSVFVTFIFAIAVGLAGRRFAATRFFLSG